MKNIMKYVLLTVALIMSVYQSAHILEHAYQDHQSQNEDTYPSLHDHQCTICHFSLHSTTPEVYVADFTINETMVEHDKQVFYQTVKQSVLFKQRSLRAPPTMI